jgi:hypothetical protein
MKYSKGPVPAFILKKVIIADRPVINNIVET